MKRDIFLTICACMVISQLLIAQDTTHAVKAQTAHHAAHKDFINGGFYILVGPVFPMGSYVLRGVSE